MRIRADVMAHYQIVPEVSATAARAGLNRLGFVSNPREAHLR
jgi:hypothetical protein